MKFTWYGKRIYAQYRGQAENAVAAASRFLTEKLKENISVSGKATGHPYAEAHRGGSYNAPHPWDIHKPGKGLTVLPPWVEKKPEMIIGRVGLNDTLVTRRIIYGTTIMRPRNVVRKTLGQYRGEVQKILRTALKGKGHAR